MFEWLTIVLGAMTAIAGLGSVIFVGMQLRQGAREIRNAAAAEEAERLRQRKRETIEAVAATTRYRQEMKAGLPWNDRDAAVVKSFLDDAESNDTAKLAVRAFLDYLEMLAVGANEGVLDVDILARLSGGRIIAVVNNYAEYIERRRKELNSYQLYSELEQLAALIETHQAARRESDAEPSGARPC